MKFLLTSLFLLCSSALSASEWSWTGFEIMGNRNISRAEIEKRLPIQLGAKYVADFELWKRTCDALIQEYSLAFAECTPVRYSNFETYFVVDIVEKGDEYRIQFLPAPVEDRVLADGVTLEVYERLQARLWKLFNEGKPSRESWKDGFLDYEDSLMHEYVMELVRLVPPYRENIIQVLTEDRDPSKRMKAADLLNWAFSTGDSVIRTHVLLNDPHAGVRNQLSRFMTHFVSGVSGSADLARILESLLIQLERPSHGDRNKSLYNLLAIIEAHPQMKGQLKEKGLPLLEHIAKTSVLSNVKGPAEELLKLVL